MILLIGYVWDSFLGSDIFGVPKPSELTTSMKVIVFITIAHLSVTKEDCERHVEIDWYSSWTSSSHIFIQHTSRKMTYEHSFLLICIETHLFQTVD